MLGLAGGAYAADFSDLGGVKAAGLKALAAAEGLAIPAVNKGYVEPVESATPTESVAIHGRKFTEVNPLYTTVNNCDPNRAERLIEAYQKDQGEITTDHLREACAVVGNVTTPLEYIVVYELSYKATCSAYTKPPKPVNLAEAEDIDQALSCLPDSQVDLKDIFMAWLAQPGCKNALKDSYRTSFQECMGDYYPQWQAYLRETPPATWSARGLSDLFLRWSVRNAPGKSGCAAGLSQMFLNDLQR